MYNKGDIVGYTHRLGPQVGWGTVDRVEGVKVWCFFDKTETVASWIDSTTVKFHVPKEYC